MKNKLKAFIVAAIISFPYINTQANSVLLFDDFNSENGGDPAFNYGSFTNWNVLNGSVDLFNDANVISRGLTPPGNSDGLYVDLDGSTFNAGRLESVLTFVLDPGLYRLEFKLASWFDDPDPSNNSVTVTLADVYAEEFSGARSTSFETILREFTVTDATSGKLIFDHSGGDVWGYALDNVGLFVVPVPAALWFFVSGIIGLAAVTNFRKKHSAKVTVND